MCGDNSAFSTLDESFRDNVKFRDNSKVSIMGKGKILIETLGNTIQTISNVLFVLDLKTNMLSIGQLQEKGYEISIKGGVCRIHDAKLGLIAQVTMSANRMFPLCLNHIEQTCFSTKLIDEAWLWHFRLRSSQLFWFENALTEKHGEKSDMVGFTDSDYTGDFDDRKSTSGYVFMFGSGVVSRSSKKQAIIILSTTEAEFVAATTCACQAIWLRKILEELHFKQEGATAIYCDNSSTIKLAKNPVLHGRSKHIDVKFHFLRDLTRDGIIDFIHCKSEDQFADIMTKPLKLSMFQKLRQFIRVCSLNKSY
ncbi:hypothetical protein GH714_005965 [Hevea brasiliensis]|uniref:Retrovirus-related Pol polyprotein from transposon TNT 1-94-like beta-barrel domain-containing protein n=1 Tax=Hevea brasiliensis TaxID=3981 RepID=A0A6A6LES1_HEVBR|nr:hypothetical protein GH714_005965 [Hevea brasiliensis]